MSLAQKAKMKFLRSLSKRKKEKICDKRFDNPPPPTPPPPQPPFSAYSTAPFSGFLNSSASLPAKLDQSEKEVTSVTSSKSEVCFEAGSLGVSGHASFRPADLPGSLSHPSPSMPSERTWKNQSNVDNLSGLEVGSSTGHCEGLQCSGYPSLQKVELQKNSKDESLPPLSRQDRFCHQLTNSETAKFNQMSQDTWSISSNMRNPPNTGTSPGPSIKGSHLLGISDGDFERCSSCEDKDIKGKSQLQLSKATESGGAYKEMHLPGAESALASVSGFSKSHPSTRYSWTSSLSTADDDVQDLYENKYERQNIHLCTNPLSNQPPSQIPGIDGSVLNKIKFFESYGKDIEKSHTISSTLSSRNKWTANKSGGGIENCLHKRRKGMKLWASAESISEISADSSNKHTNKDDLESSCRVLKGATDSSQRKNFIYFRKSDSIPEELDTCSRRCDEVSTSATKEMNTNSCDDTEDVKDAMTKKSKDESDVLYEVSQKLHISEERTGALLMISPQSDLDTHKNSDPDKVAVITKSKQKQEFPSVLPTLPPVYNESAKSESQRHVKGDKAVGPSLNYTQKPRTKLPPRELKRKFSKILTLKKRDEYDLEAALNAISDPERSELATLSSMESNEDDNGWGRNDSTSKSRLPGMDALLDHYHVPALLRQDSVGSPFETIPSSADIAQFSRASVGRKTKIPNTHGYFTIQFGDGSGFDEDLEEVPVLLNTTLRDSLEYVLAKRNMDPYSVNVYVENSRTPLPLTSDTSYLAGHKLQVKEKDKDLDSTSQGKTRQNSNKSGSVKGNKSIGREARRESVGVMSLLLEPPSQPTKQRRGSLQLPFRDHFFGRGDSKSSDAIKVYDDSFGSIRSKSSNFPADDSFFSTSSPIGSLSDSKRGKSPKMSVVGLFGPTNKERERQDHLSEILNRFSLHGLPPFPELLALGRPKFDDAIFELESSWTFIVGNNQGLTTKQQDHQEAVWELLRTEVSYIRQLRVIIDVFQSCLINIQQESFLNEIETDRLFSNIYQVYECNCLFWQSYLLPVLHHSRESGRPLDPILFKEGFVDHFPNLFGVYFKYLNEHKSCLDYAKSCMENSDLFKIFLQWAEMQKQCNRRKLVEMLVHPMSRLLQYSLLLQAILKYTDSDREKGDLQEMIESVDRLCRAVNSSLRRREEFEKLKDVNKTIEPFDAIETPNDECAKIIQEYTGNFSLLAPMAGIHNDPRCFIFQCSLKMRESQNAKLDVDCLLFTDLLLICKPNKKTERFHIIRPPMQLDHLVVRELKDRGSFLLIYMNEYNVPVSAFTFHSDTGVIRGWLDKFRDAQREFKHRENRERAELDRLRNSGDFQDGSVVPTSSYLDPGSSILHRSESMDSADRYMPILNDLTSDNGQLELSSSGSVTDDFQGRSSRRELTRANTDTKLVGNSSSPLNKYDQDSTDGGERGPANVPTHFQTSQSVPNMAGSRCSFTQGSPENNTTGDFPGSHTGTDEADGRLSCDQPKDGEEPPPQGSAPEPNSLIDEEDIAKLKLNSRRVSRTEKRYHTADEIQTIRDTPKDSSIHKRLSWRMDVQISDPSRFASKVTSADSLHSFQSSSGVSSNGSVQQLIVAEEHAAISDQGAAFRDRSPAKIDRHKLFSVGDSGDISDEVDFNSGRARLSESKHSKSRSTSDIATLFNSSPQVSQMQDGIASVATSTDIFNRKLTHSEILKFKKIKEQILHDANVESSEV